MEQKKEFYGRGLGRTLAAVALFCGLLLAGLVVAVKASPSLGANGAEVLRKVIGDQPVAWMETWLYRVEDRVLNAEYRLGLVRPSTPWHVSASPTTAPVVSGAPGRVSTPAAHAPTPPTATPGSPDIGKPIVAEAPWKLGPVTPLGTLKGEGVWVPELQDPTGRVVAQKMFLQPDPARPYAVVGVVAFDLAHTRLHFVLGTEEPYDQGVTQRAEGQIPAGDQAPGVLLAAFNGGFKVAHGHFGAMADGLTAVPPRQGLATLALYVNGQVKMGVFGGDIQLAPDLLAYRQNGPLIIQAGQVTAEVDTPALWGFTVKGSAVTWRSGLGLSADGRTLMYFAGPFLTIRTLADAMKATGVQSAMQLDINPYWVHFDAFRSMGGKLTSEPLFPKDMQENDGRFLKRYLRDFFYLTTELGQPASRQP